ncbi:stress responsive A/B barrel domain-containing protein [Xylariaceae sp. FL0255]|nr:stress responsive A/B barrel domain-containing protein [Xylariaceae sp. FL0255]
MPVNHLVLFQFKADATNEEIKKAFAGMLSLKDSCVRPVTKIPYIKSFTGGKDNSPEGLQNGIQYAFVVVFESLEDRDFYVNKDEAHKAFVASASPVIEKAIVVDYSF